MKLDDLKHYLEEDFIHKGYKILVWNADPLIKSRVVFIWHHEENRCHLGILSLNTKKDLELLPKVLFSKTLEFKNLRLNDRFAWADTEYDNKNVSISKNVYFYSNSVGDSLQKLQKEFLKMGYKVNPRIKKQPYLLPKRLALVIGNDSYEHGGSLKNAVNDAHAISKKLEGLSYSVTYGTNLTQKSFRKLIDEFAIMMTEYDEAVFYYAGHGIQYEGKNYFVPTDANLIDAKNIEYDCIPFERVFSNINNLEKKVMVMIFDTCRVDVLSRNLYWNNVEIGLAPIKAPAGLFIAYSTSPGEIASDGRTSNSPYTKALLKYLHWPALPIETLFKKVRNEVEEDTRESGRIQVPWESTSLKDEFYFNKSTDIA